MRGRIWQPHLNPQLKAGLQHKERYKPAVVVNVIIMKRNILDEANND
jgi:hypothetical protein